MSGVGKRARPKYAILMHNRLLDKLFLSYEQNINIFFNCVPDLTINYPSFKNWCNKYSGSSIDLNSAWAIYSFVEGHTHSIKL